MERSQHNAAEQEGAGHVEEEAVPEGERQAIQLTVRLVRPDAADAHPPPPGGLPACMWNPGIIQEILAVQLGEMNPPTEVQVVNEGTALLFWGQRREGGGLQEGEVEAGLGAEVEEVPHPELLAQAPLARGPDVVDGDPRRYRGAVPDRGGDG